MDTESVRLFVLAAEKLNISAAGRDLGMAPAVASTRLAKLETLVGAELLHRSTRKVTLSQDGAEFLPYAREILAQEDTALAVLGRKNPEVTGTLRFAASSTFAQLYIVPLLPEFLERHPQLRLDLRLSDAQFDLIEGSFDLALRNTILEDTSLKCRKLAHDTRVLCAAPSYLERFGIPQDPNDLSHHKLIAFRDLSAKTLVAENGKTGFFDPGNSDCQLAVDDGLSHKLATIAGLGISANALWNIQAELVNGTLVRVLPDYELVEQTALWLVYPKSNVLTAKVRVFIDFLLETIGRKPPWLRTQ